MELEISRCGMNSFPEIGALVNRVFVESKGRSRKMQKSLPNLCTPEATDNVYIATLDGALVGTTTVRKFRWEANGICFTGAMVGLVCTDEKARGLGVASQIMTAITKDLEVDGTDFGVLWTKIHGFYQRLGWRLCDVGGFGRLSLYGTGAGLVQPVPCAASHFDILEAIRHRFAAETVQRRPVDYTVIPPYVDSVDLYLTGSRVTSSYALVGNRKRTGFLYEMLGDPADFECLARSVLQRCDEVYVNESRSGAFGQWLASYTGTLLADQDQTMWRTFTNRCKEADFAAWYIPYFDRI